MSRGPASGRSIVVFDRAAERRIYLHPGQMVVAAEPAEITTILGSCVSVCLHDPENGVGAMNHFLLPGRTAAPQAPGRCAAPATRLLFERVLQAGARRDQVVALVYGGASVIAGGAAVGRPLGDENVRAALDTLAELDVPVCGGDVGGTRGRRLVFRTGSGEGRATFL